MTVPHRAQGERTHLQALEALVAASVERLAQAEAREAADTMLFLGNRHAAFPLLVLHDPVLEPVDKIVWMAVVERAREIGGNTAFPSYQQLARIANVSSSATIARAVAILRLTRWLTLCAQVRDRSGRFKGHVYAVHDEPLALTDGLELDRGYLTFVRHALEHHHARVRRVAAGVLETLDEQIAAGADLSVAAHPFARRLEAARAVNADGPRPFFSFSAQVMAKLRNTEPVSGALEHQSQNLKVADRLQILQSQNLKTVGCCSCSYIYKTTTTTNTEIVDGSSRARANALAYPPRLDANQRELASRYLATVPVAVRQAVLDELEGRLRAEQRGATPVHDVIRYLHQLCAVARAGELVQNLGVGVREEREQRRTTASPEPAAPGGESAHRRAATEQRATPSAAQRAGLEAALRIVGLRKTKPREGAE